MRKLPIVFFFTLIFTFIPTINPLVQLSSFVYTNDSHRYEKPWVLDIQASSFAHSDILPATDPPIPQKSQLFGGLEFASFVLVIVALLASLYVIYIIGTGMINVTFISFAAGVFFIFLSRAFMYLADEGVYQLSDATFHIWWHLLFYLSMLSFIWGGMRLQQISGSEKPEGFHGKDILVLGSLLLASAGIFLIANPVEPALAQVLTGSSIHAIGLHHFLAVVLAVQAASLMLYIKKNWGQILAIGMTPVLIFIILMGVQHLWELLTESWQLLNISESSIEQVEQFIVIPAFFFLIYGMTKIAMYVHAQVASTPTVAKNINSS